MRGNKTFLVAVGMTLWLGASAQVILYDNGPVVTHPGQGFGGADVSMASVNPNSAGSNQWLSAPGPHFRAADNFTVPVGAVWIITQIRTWGYATNAAPGSPGWTGFHLRIWSGTPGTGTIVFETTGPPTITFSNIYRVFNGAGNLQNTQRALNWLDYTIPNVTLTPGTYWIDQQVSGGSSGWYNYVMDINPADPNNPITRAGDAMQLTTTGWGPALAGSPAVNVEFPFEIRGVPEPATFLALATGLSLVALRRRKR